MGFSLVRGPWWDPFSLCSSVTADLPITTLGRTLKGRNKTQVFSEQISRRIKNDLKPFEVPWEDDAFEDLHKKINQLACLPEGRVPAACCLVDLILEWTLINKDYDDDDDELTFINYAYRKDDDDLAELLQAHFMALRETHKDWNPASLLDKVESSAKKAPRGVEGDEFMAANWYLRRWTNWRYSNILANKVAGDRLPAELVDIIRDYLYPCQVDLTIPIRQWYWFCSEGCQRRKPTLSSECDKDENGQCRLQFSIKSPRVK